MTTGNAPTIEFKEFCRKQIAELADWCEGFDMTGVSVSDADKQAGSPKIGDKIARNPKNHADKWLVAADYFADNFEPVKKLAALESQQKLGKCKICNGNDADIPCAYTTEKPDGCLRAARLEKPVPVEPVAWAHHSSIKSIITPEEKAAWATDISGRFSRPLYAAPAAQWRRVEDGLPEKGKDVLLCVFDIDAIDGRLQQKRLVINGRLEEEMSPYGPVWSISSSQVIFWREHDMPPSAKTCNCKDNHGHQCNECVTENHQRCECEIPCNRMSLPALPEADK